MRNFGNTCWIALAAGLALLVLAPGWTAAQMDLMDLSLDDLLDIKIIEAITKNPEEAFKAPLSVSVVNEDEILRSGATSIPDALRMVPGVLVREPTPGVYDVQVRGFGNASVNSMLPYTANAMTLVMIDYRIVYNYFASGAFWETLPIGLHDVKRIEVIRGPSSALYGPNAVAGVINIVTKQPDMPGTYANVNVQGGTENTMLLNGAVGFRHKSTMNGVLSVNYHTRARHMEEYYQWTTRSYVTVDQLHSMMRPDDALTDLDTRYPEKDRALERVGVNLFYHYKLSEKSEMNLSFGRQESQTQKIYVNNYITPLTTNESNTNYADMKFLVEKDTRVQLSYIDGDQETLGMPDWKYELNVFEAVIEHDIHWKKLTLRPGVSYRMANYDGSFIGGSQQIINESASLLVDYKPTSKLRLMGALRGDRYQHTDNAYASYLASATYNFNLNNMVRVVASRSNRTCSMLETYIDHTIPLDLSAIHYAGNKELASLTMDTWELGYRTKLTRDLTVDLEGYYAYLNNFSDLLYAGTDNSGSNLEIEYGYVNYEMTATQVGGSVDLQYDLSRSFFIKLFGSFQQTEYDDEAQEIIRSALNIEVETMPALYGGFELNYKPMSKLNLNINGVYAGEQEFQGVLGTMALDAGLNLNTRLSYTVLDGMDVFVNARNLLTDGEKQYGFADDIGRVILAGFTYTY